jgi:hypothetical protein
MKAAILKLRHELRQELRTLRTECAGKLQAM